jgi:hypothetical protein
MKRFFSVLALLLSISLPAYRSVIACTVNIESFRKNFRHSKQVFLGEIVAIDQVKTEELPKEIREAHQDYKFLSKITFNVEHSWKGDRKKQITAYSTMFCTCPNRFDYFSIGEKYLVFLDKNAYFDSCNLNNSKADSTDDEIFKGMVRRLDRFWFRTWARTYPF